MFAGSLRIVPWQYHRSGEATNMHESMVIMLHIFIVDIAFFIPCLIQEYAMQFSCA